jgi:type I restriction enzyme S subunit
MIDARRQTQTGGRVATGGYIPGDVALSVGMPTEIPPVGFSWKLLADLARLETGHTPSRRVPGYWENGTLPWIGVRDATRNHGRTIVSTNENITELGEQNSSTRLLPMNTVCLSRTASVGYVVVMGVPMCTSQDFVNWVCGPELDFRYLKYILLGEKEAFLRFASGTTHQTVYFPEVKAFHVMVPSVSEQQAIAGVLGALDDKIESNRRMVDLLSRLIPLVFQAGIGEFEYRNLPDVATVHKGVSYRSVDLQDSDTAMMTLKSFDRNGGYKSDGLKSYVGVHKPTQVLQPGEIVVAQTDLTQGAEVVGRAVVVPRQSRYQTLIASLDLLIVRPIETDDQWFLYGALIQEEFREHCRSRTSGTTVLHLGSDALPTYQVPWADQNVRRAIADEIESLVSMNQSLDQESEKLSALRDALLPELLSGRLRVRDAEKVVEEVV